VPRWRSGKYECRYRGLSKPGGLPKFCKTPRQERWFCRLYSNGTKVQFQAAEKKSLRPEGARQTGNYINAIECPWK